MTRRVSGFLGARIMANQNTWGVNVARLKLATMVGRTSDEDE